MMIFHIDMANQYEQKSYSIITLVSVNTNNQKDNQTKKGIVIADPLRKDLLKDYSKIHLHAALISMLVENIKPIKKIIICCDIAPVDKVMGAICELRPELVFGIFEPLSELREKIGSPHYKSEADAFARNINRNYEKRRNFHRKKEYFKDGSVVIISDKSDEYEALLEKLKRFKENNR